MTCLYTRSCRPTKVVTGCAPALIDEVAGGTSCPWAWVKNAHRVFGFYYSTGISLGSSVLMHTGFSGFTIIIIIEGLSLLQIIPPTTANKQTQAQKQRGSRARQLLGAV